MRDESGSDELSLGTRRLCAVLVGGPPGLLASACRSVDDDAPAHDQARFGRLFIAPAPGGEIAIAPAGVDEMRLVRDLVSAVCTHVTARGSAVPPFLALNVGIVRIEDDGFAGFGLARARALASDPAVRHRAGGVALTVPANAAQLALVLPDSFYGDLCAEGLAREDWHEVPEAAAWIKWLSTRMLEKPWNRNEGH